MTRVLILSPHCDDIPLSLGASLLAREWGEDVRGVVFFSESRYTLADGWNNDPAVATAMRMEEERRAAELGGYRVDFLGFPEPGVRSGYTQPRDIFSSDLAVDEEPVWKAIDEQLRSLVEGFEGVVLCPLGVGRHIDHRIVATSFQAALRAGARAIPGFYEDLPYAARFTSQDIRRLVPSGLPGAPLAPALFSRGNLAAKMRLLEVYESQLSPDDYDSVAAHWDCRGRAELVWLPEGFTL